MRRLSRRTVRLRLTLLYGGVFLLSGAALLALAYALVGQTTSGPDYSAALTAGGAIVKGSDGARVNPETFLPGPARPLGEASAQTNATPKGPREGPRALLRTLTRGAYAAGPGRLELPGGGVVTVDQARAQTRKAELQTLADARAQARKLESLGRRQHSDEMHRLLLDLGIALAIVALLSLGLGWFLAGRLLRPLQTITRAARAISAKSLHRRLALRGPRDELREVGDTFDELLERLERSFEAQRQFVANASHELRTPLTLERTIVEVALADPRASNETLRATCERVLAIGEQQERMIDALLTLARSERGVERSDPIDLTALAREAIAARAAELASNGLRLESELAQARTSGDANLLERLIANLIDNAARYNVNGGWVRVSTATAGARAILTVSNSGPVVPVADVDRLLRPFQRIGAARASRGDGHGLGLSIVSAVAAAHGAELQAHARPEGGLHVSVSFAAAAVPRTPDDDRAVGSAAAATSGA